MEIRSVTIRKNFDHILDCLEKVIGTKFEYNDLNNRVEPIAFSGHAWIYKIVDDYGKIWALKLWDRKSKGIKKSYDLAQLLSKRSSVFLSTRYLGVLKAGEIKVPAAIVEWQEGVSLYKWCKKSFGKKSSKSFDEMTEKVKAVATFLHDENILHQDVKASNLMVTRGGELKMIDYDNLLEYGGVAHKAVVGTPAYLHVDQLTAMGTGKPVVDQSWDGFGFVVILASLELMSLCPHTFNDQMAYDDESVGIPCEALHDPIKWKILYGKACSENIMVHANSYVRALNDAILGDPIVVLDALYIAPSVISTVSHAGSKIIHKVAKSIQSSLNSGAVYVKARVNSHKIIPPRPRLVIRSPRVYTPIAPAPTTWSTVSLKGSSRQQRLQNLNTRKLVVPAGTQNTNRLSELVRKMQNR